MLHCCIDAPTYREFTVFDYRLYYLSIENVDFQLNY